MAKLPRRHDVFPLDPAGAVFIFTDFIAAGLQIDDAFLTLPVDFTAAVKVAGNVVINFYTRRFGTGKTIDTFGECWPESAVARNAAAKDNLRYITNSISNRARNVTNVVARCNQLERKTS